MNDVIQRIYRNRILPVAVIEDSDQTIDVARALLLGELDCIGVTFKTNTAKDSIRLIKEKQPEMLIGAGTVLTVK